MPVMPALAVRAPRAVPVATPPKHARAWHDLREMIETLVSASLAIPAATLRTRTRGHARAAAARQTAMYIAHVALGLNFAQTGRLFDRDRTTAAQACRRIEDLRDDPAFDLTLAALEKACARFAAARLRSAVQ